MSVKAAVEELDFRNEGEMWCTEIILYICCILIWYLLIKILWFFCISGSSPRFKQYDARALKPIKARAEQSRIRRQSETPNPSTTTSLNKEPKNGRAPSISRTQQKQNNSSPSYRDETPEEFQLQICKIHRSLRLCFVTSLICTTLNVTTVMLNHTVIISGAAPRDCIVSRLPVTFILCQRLALYLFFIFRLHYSFGATQFGIKSIYIWSLIISIVLIGGLATAYFFIVIVTATDPCASDIASKASAPAIAQDLFFNLLLSVLFLSRLGAAVKSQSKFRGGSTRNLEKAKLKKARSNYKYYYTMYKLTCLFVVAAIITIIGFIIIYITGLAAASSTADSVISNYLLFLSFQFNDQYFRVVFCGCLKIQSLFLGKEYAKEMELYFVTNAKKPAHRQSSQTWQDQDVETTNHTMTTKKIDKIEEEQDNINNNNDNDDDDDDNGKMTVVVTADDNDRNDENEDNEDKPVVNRINTVDSDISNDLTMSNETGPNVPNTPIDNDNELTMSNDNESNDTETQILAKKDDDHHQTP